MGEFEDRVERFRARKSPEDLLREALTEEGNGVADDRLQEERRVRGVFERQGYLMFLLGALEFARGKDGKPDARLVFEQTTDTDPRFPDAPISQVVYRASLQWDIAEGSVSQGFTFADMSLSLGENRDGSVRVTGEKTVNYVHLRGWDYVEMSYVEAYHRPGIKVPINGVHPENTPPASS